MFSELKLKVHELKKSASSKAPSQAIVKSFFNRLMADSYFIYYLHACFKRYRDHQG